MAISTEHPGVDVLLFLFSGFGQRDLYQAVTGRISAGEPGDMIRLPTQGMDPMAVIAINGKSPYVYSYIDIYIYICIYILIFLFI